MGFNKILDTAGRTIGQLAYVNSPIILTGGVADKLGGTVPILLYTEALGFVNGLISGGIGGKLAIPDLDNQWCQWQPIPGTALINNEIAQYPFANQTVAANAVISRPIHVSMLMTCYARGSGAMVTKLATLQSLQAILNKHSTMGGTFIIITPGQIYTNMLLVRMEDVSHDYAHAPASEYLFHFERPLTQKSEAAQKKGTLMSKLAGGAGGMKGWGATGSGNLLEGALDWTGII